MILWLNGRLVEAEAARIDPTDRGLLLGDGLFETMRAVGGRVPLLDRHLVRLRAAAATLELPVPATDAELAAACAELLRAAGLAEAALRLTLTRGPGPRGLMPPATPTPTLLLAAAPCPAPPAAARAVVVQGVRRNELAPSARLKSLGYLDQLLALREAQAAGAEEAILLNTAGRPVCAATANLFLLGPDGLATPPVAEGALPGVTRGLVIELARELGVPCAERPLGRAGLIGAEGVFLTSSLVGPRAVVAIDGRAVGAGTPHPLTSRLQAMWRRRLGMAGP